MHSSASLITMKSGGRRETAHNRPLCLTPAPFSFLGNSLRNLQLSVMPNLLLSGLIIDLFCYIYPAYCSLKAVKNNNITEIVQWISYWIVASALVLTEKMVIFSTIEPVFSILRRSLCIWCLLPIPNNGATLIYQNVLFRIMNNESPGRVFRDLSRNISLERMQRKAQEIRDTVTEKIRGGRSDVTAHSQARPEAPVTPDRGETSQTTSAGQTVPRIIDCSQLDATED